MRTPRDDDPRNRRPSVLDTVLLSAWIVAYAGLFRIFMAIRRLES
jgi:hypothetical protein